ncbi:MAG: AAA family ATPase [Spirochaetes bacterium]|nr:AAA family ATPase [Spirochaetota bacterium]MBN2769512.1 AAA family ATPase [Spirochaetota bacterium]
MDYIEIEKLTELAKKENSAVQQLRDEIRKVIVGQDYLIDRIIIAFLCDGHILLEGLPGLAKTLAVRAFAKTIDSDFARIQFTPDLLPADILGTQIYNPKTMEFSTKKGPIFSNIVLADEINRAPAKVQSALLEAMEERQVTIGDESFPFAVPFMVLATENPIEQEGTYPLPEAQLDRFFMKCLVHYPTEEEEFQVLNRYSTISVDAIKPVISSAELVKKREFIQSIYIDEKLLRYIVSIVNFTRKPSNPDVARFLEFGASPRASIALMKASRCVAFINGRGFVTPEDIKEIGYDVLRHRIILSYEAEAEDVTNEDVCRMIFDSVEVP